MNKRYERWPSSNAADLATGSILAIIVAMTISTAAHAEYRCSTPGSPAAAPSVALRDAADAHKALEARATSGSTVLTIEPSVHRSFP